MTVSWARRPWSQLGASMLRKAREEEIVWENGEGKEARKEKKKNKQKEERAKASKKE